MRSEALEQPSPATLDFIYEAIKDAPERSIRDSEALDTKIVQLFAAASIVIGLAAFPRISSGSSVWVTALLCGGLVFYLLGAVAVLLSLRAYPFQRPISAKDLWALSWQDSPDAIRHCLIASITKVSEINRKNAKSKAALLNLALGATAFETACICGAIIASRAG